MTDDDRLAALFRDAATSSDPPPPGFDLDRVVATSRRITARRRSAVLGGAMALLVVAGVAVALPTFSGAGDVSSAAAPAAAPPQGEAAPEVAAEPYLAPDGPAPGEAAPGEAVPGEAATVPEALRDVPPFTGVPLGPSAAECAPRQDPDLRAYVEQVLPEVVGAPEAAVTTECRPGGERGVSLDVDDAGTAGLLSVLYLPPGAAVPPTSGAIAQAATASGGTVVVGARGAGAGTAVPFEGRLDTAAAFLAPRL